ncbi:DNA-packaging protein [Novosphingobium sp.]|uniref:DNA-packaging protein n=1 Tax=Novosphingobium sp. TaxID=1874826 RepID=UPI003BAB1079
MSGDRLDFLRHDEHRLAHALPELLTEAERDAVLTNWPLWARASQLPPPGNWRVWLIMAGRGFGKTRAGAEWVRMVAERDHSARIALVASSLHEARSVMVEGESGLMAVSPPHLRPRYEPSLRRIVWPGGAQALLYSAAEAETLRGPQHSHAWCDEIAKWDDNQGQARRCWDNLMLGLRLGDAPQIVATTTPRAVPLVRRLMAQVGADDAVVLTRGSTTENEANLPTRFLADVAREFGGTVLGRQELDGELIDDLPGALWTRGLIETCRETGAGSAMTRVIVGVDPPASADGDACGIIACGLGEDGVARVLADASVEKASPERWARAVAEAARAWSADRVVVEANQGGAMVEAVLRAANAALPLRLVHAARGKVARAEPVAALYEAGRVRHAGLFARLEDELCGLLPGGTYQGPGRSPDRADACVWALTELMLGRSGEPRIWID